MKTYDRHILVCNDDDCCDDGGGKQVLKAVRQQLGKRAKGVKCSKVSCLGQCKHGPVMIVYPDGVWYRCPNKQALQNIIETHLIGGEIAKDHVLFTMPQPPNS
ncbi:MAG: hypothetical protein CL610_12790 [Anaerolineaceae bacterium]|nr:hypothetical protein [Anaerolineaceae bacterium]